MGTNNKYINNMERYKVIKNFGLAKKGDIFDKVQLEDEEVMYIMEREEEMEDKGFNACSYVGITLGEEDMERRINEGFVAIFNDEIDENDTAVDETVLVDQEKEKLMKTLNNTEKRIDDLILTYEQDHKKVELDYKKGNVQPCVKVEADTVYFNMIKVLKEIKNTLLQK